MRKKHQRTFYDSFAVFHQTWKLSETEKQANKSSEPNKKMNKILTRLGQYANHARSRNRVNSSGRYFHVPTLFNRHKQKLRDEKNMVNGSLKCIGQVGNFFADQAERLAG